jgi:5'(3')-deoxyribonucleotidase
MALSTGLPTGPPPLPGEEPRPAFTLGVDLDGVCADYSTAMRPIAAEWLGVPERDLPEDHDWAMTRWGVHPEEVFPLLRFAVTERDLYRSMPMLAGAGPALRRLSAHVSIRIITHRLVVQHAHQRVVAETVEWLDHHGIPYTDLCFIGPKGEVDADLYLEDGPHNLRALLGAHRDVIAFSHYYNRDVRMPRDHRALDWREAEPLVDAHLRLPSPHRLSLTSPDPLPERRNAQ